MINLWSFLLETIYLEIAVVSYCYICFGFFLAEFFTFPIFPKVIQIKSNEITQIEDAQIR